MRIRFFSARRYDEQFFAAANEAHGFQLNFSELPLRAETAPLVENGEVVCMFVNDVANADVLDIMAARSVPLLALRSAGFNHVNLRAAAQHGIPVVRVPAYSPYSVAEHTVALVLTLNRKTHRAYNRVRENNFLLDGLMGFDLHGLTVGLVGMGKIGLATARIFLGFGCKVLGYDVHFPDEAAQLGVQSVELEALFRSSDIVSLHCPLTPDTQHLINDHTLHLMKRGVMLINTSRGALVDARAVIGALKTGHVGYLGLDVYEEEGDIFFEDLSDRVIQDDVFMRLLSFSNVLVTGHQAFFTRNALQRIAEVTLQNVADFAAGRALENQVRAEEK